MKHIYTSIDIGSDTIKIVVCELYQNKLNLLAVSSQKSDGIKKGLIIEPELAKEAVKKGLREIEAMLGIKIKKVIATIPSYMAEFSLAKGEVSVFSEDGIVTEGDISNSYKAAYESKIKQGYSLINIIPIDFKLDEQVIKRPKGMAGAKLISRVILVTAPRKNIYSVSSLLDSLRVELVAPVLNGIGDMYAFEEENNEIGAIINIGDNVTSVSLFNKGAILKNRIIDMGSKHIEQDISYVYKISLNEARTIKEKFALAHKRNANVNEFYEITNKLGKKHKLNQYEVTEIVMSRIEEILNLSKKEIKLLTNKQIQYIIVTGGASNMQGFEYIAHQVLGKNASVGNIKLIGARNNKYSSAIGNIAYYISTLRIKGVDYSMVSESDEEEMSSPKRNIFSVSNESTLGKVFSYFFGE